VCSLVGYNPAQSGQTALLPIVLAMFHTCFNITNTALLIGFIPQMERAVCWLLPANAEAKTEGITLKYIQAGLVSTPEIAVLQAQKETAHFAKRMRDMFAKAVKLMDTTDSDAFVKLHADIAHEEDLSDQAELAIAEYLEQVSNDHLSDETKHKIRQMMREVSELESIGDACYKLARTLQRRQEQGVTFTAEQADKLHRMTMLADDALEQMCLVMRGHRFEHDIRETYRIENEVNAMRDLLKRENIRAVNDHQYDYALGTLYIDLVNEIEKLCDYVVNVVQARFGK
jgi:phosphate:Na+ symporter